MKGKSLIYLLCSGVIVFFAYLFFGGYGIATVALLFVAIFAYLKYPLICCVVARRKYGLDDERGCVKWFERAYKSKRCVPSLKVTYAYYLIRLSNIIRAEFILNDLLKYSSKLKPDERMMAKQNLSLLMYKTERFSQAMELMEEVFANYKTTAVYGVLGYYKILADTRTNALDFCKESYEYNNQDKIIIDNLVQAHYNMGNYREAKELCDSSLNKSILKKQPIVIEQYFHAALLENKIGDKQEALDHLINLQECRRSMLTTISVNEINKLTREVCSALNKNPDEYIKFPDTVVELKNENVQFIDEGISPFEETVSGNVDDDN